MPAAGSGGMPRLALSGIRKVYPSVVANDGIDLAVLPGEIHAVLGENGAGKSTLMKIIYGVVKPDAGEVRWEGRPVEIPNPHAARALGIGMVFQHFSLFDTLTAAQNVWLGLDRALPLAEVARSIRAKAAEYGVEVDPERPVHTLSVGERQRVEIVRALLGEPRLLILDEPTSVLTPQAVEKLFATLRLAAARGCSILYISHKLDEIRALCHSCTVLRAGRVTGVVDPRTATSADLSRLMIGAEPPRLQHRAVERGPVTLEARGLSLERGDEFGVTLEAVDLQVHAGEVVGIAGVSGNGQKELLAALSGEDRRAAPGCIRLFGDDVARESPGRRRRRGLHYVPEERLGRGAVPTLGLAHNVLLTRREAVRPGGWLDLGRMAAMTQRIIERFNVKASGPASAARSLSGGNLQKYIVGREIDAQPKVLIVAQPTWGVDVGASAQIRAELLALRDAGCAVLVVSEELDELFEITDRLYVIARGRLSPAIATAAATPERIGQWMSGLWAGEGAAHAPA
jgi:general nucleoside transport system ATP-binding protein